MDIAAQKCYSYMVDTITINSNSYYKYLRQKKEAMAWSGRLIKTNNERIKRNEETVPKSSNYYVNGYCCDGFGRTAGACCKTT